ncbi:uncharacterized protein K02A2.6-like [Rhipicephalus sanguineus]|uniref:uncharacterized protein K02A2.6-like n=1 Tax=Rhipicephalus sanguineus TaxID=34632 RepID=UPI0020C58FA9|nr:uncharacterized protein K02A2.6-like [Rhipicephalus sanguineus]
MLPSTTPSRPWEEVGIDLFHLNGQDFVLLVDYRSRFPEVISLRSTTALAVINAVKSVFARHGIPRLVRSDNGPQFAAKEFSAFAKSYGFCHVTSSPHFPQSNGEVERMVRTVKDLLRKADDPYLALLVYRDTPGVNGAGERVWVRDVNSPATVLGPAQRPRSYVVETPTGVLQRNRMHLVPTTGTPTANPPVTPVADQPETTTTPGADQAAQDQQTTSPRERTSTAEEPQGSASTPRVSRSRYGRRIRRPKRLDP